MRPWGEVKTIELAMLDLKNQIERHISDFNRQWPADSGGLDGETGQRRGLLRQARPPRDGRRSALRGTISPAPARAERPEPHVALASARPGARRDQDPPRARQRKPAHRRVQSGNPPRDRPPCTARGGCALVQAEPARGPQPLVLLGAGEASDEVAQAIEAPPATLEASPRLMSKCCSLRQGPSGRAGRGARGGGAWARGWSPICQRVGRRRREREGSARLRR